MVKRNKKRQMENRLELDKWPHLWHNIRGGGESSRLRREAVLNPALSEAEGGTEGLSRTAQKVSGLLNRHTIIHSNVGSGGMEVVRLLRDGSAISLAGPSFLG